MKKLIAISLLAIHLFNLAGYGLVVGYFIQQSDDQMIARLDTKNYDESRLVEVKVPLNLPYMQGSLEYERVDGSIDHEGIQYNYVKRRLYNDTLSILCLPNDEKTSIVKGSVHLSKELNDFPAGKKDKQSAIKKSGLSADFVNLIPDYTLTIPVSFKCPSGKAYSQPLFNVTRFIPERPPQVS